MSDRAPRSRIRIVVSAAVVVALGLLGRQLPGLVGDVVGGLLYGILVYLLLALVARRARPVSVALSAAAVGVAIELLQLTGVPAQLGQLWAPLRLVLGSTFVPLDLLVAVAGAALGMVAELVLTGSHVHRRRQPPG